MGPMYAAKVMLARGITLNTADPGASLVCVFDLADELGGSLWSEFSFLCAYIYLGFRGQILCYSEGWYALPVRFKVENGRGRLHDENV